jgi:hypothetical protein
MALTQDNPVVSPAPQLDQFAERRIRSTPLFRGIRPLPATGVHSKVPPAHFCSKFASPAGIMETALGLLVRFRAKSG